MVLASDSRRPQTSAITWSLVPGCLTGSAAAAQEHNGCQVLPEKEPGAPARDDKDNRMREGGSPRHRLTFEDDAGDGVRLPQFGFGDVAGAFHDDLQHGGGAGEDERSGSSDSPVGSPRLCSRPTRQRRRGGGAGIRRGRTRSGLAHALPSINTRIPALRSRLAVTGRGVAGPGLWRRPLPAGNRGLAGGDENSCPCSHRFTSLHNPVQAG
ncbi:hypothetical protein NDU88_007948 [Pleurodeles waltl]|uniref:Secreted protein n=1 Tax=Pleurodeles waltl TaxID=8319 RepID=A0AAV7QTA1_PLEWA|nr:hypothetical protein NDU88_007948 [Pleurodeles waltl]